MIGILLLAMIAANGADFVKVPRSERIKKPSFVYRVGGPLAGVELPPYPTYFGEPAGHPGNSRQMEYQLYPGAVEHYRAYEGFSRAKFDIQSQLYRFTAPELPGCTGKPGRFAQTLIERYGSHTLPDKREPAVDVRWCGAGDTVLAATFDLPRGLYCVRAVTAANTEDQLTPVRKTLIGEFSVKKEGDSSVQPSTSFPAQVHELHGPVLLHGRVLLPCAGGRRLQRPLFVFE